MSLESVAIVIGDETDPRTGRIGDYFGFWQDVEIKRSIDTYSSVTFHAPFEHSRPEFRETFRPFSFKRLELLVSLETLFTGFVLGIDPDFEANAKRVTVTGYAKPAVFCDCMVSPDDNGKGLQFNKLGLLEIAKQLAAPFAFECDFRGVESTPFAKAKLEIDKKIQDFLVDLAKQRSAVLTDTPAGDLLCWQSVEPGHPVATFVEGTPPLTKVSAKFSPQDYYSEITGFGKKKRGKGEARFTALNAWLEKPLRPHTFKLEDSERADVPEATFAKLGRMFANMASFTLHDLPGWRDPSGKLWEPNTTLLLTAPSAMVYRETELLIRDVTFKQDSTNESTTLELVLPGAFNGKIPDELPWDEVDA